MNYFERVFMDDTVFRSAPASTLGTTTALVRDPSSNNAVATSRLSYANDMRVDDGRTGYGYEEAVRRRVIPVSLR